MEIASLYMILLTVTDITTHSYFDILYITILSYNLWFLSLMKSLVETLTYNMPLQACLLKVRALASSNVVSIVQE